MAVDYQTRPPQGNDLDVKENGGSPRRRGGGGTKWLSTVVPWVELVVNVRGKPDTMVWVCGTLLSNFVDRVKRDDILELAQIA